MSLPQPTTFAEGQRRLYGFAAGAAGIAFGLAVLGGAAIVVFGNWGAQLVRAQLYILGGLVAAGTINTTIVVVGLLVGGPVGRFNVKASDGQRSVEMDATGNGQ